MELRPAVLAFARAMENRLRENDWKGGWKGCERAELLPMLIHNVSHLAEKQSGGSLVEQAERIRTLQNAADIANYAMMIADNIGALDGLRALPEGVPSD